MRTTASAGPYLDFGEFRLDVAAESVWRGGSPIVLRRKAVQVLHYLAARRGRVVGHAELLGAVWTNTHVSPAVLKVCVQEIREALGDQSRAPRFIETVPRQGYRWIADVEGAAGPTPGSASSHVFGRDEELHELLGALERARAGERQVVFVTGEAGIGKTTLVDAFVTVASAVVEPPHVGRGQCIDHFGSGEPYLPLLAALGELCRVSGKPFVDLLARSAPTWLLQMPSLLTEPVAEELRRRTLGVGRERMLRELAEAFEVLTEGRGRDGSAPVVLILEDLHWSDAATVDFLGFVARRRQPARLLIVGTYRPSEALVRRNPLGGVRQELRIGGLCRDLPLPPLNESAVAQYVADRFGEDVLCELPRPLQRSTEGNPLFVVQVVNYLVTRGMIAEVDGAWRLRVEIDEILRTVPEDLRELIEREAELVSPSERLLLEAASVAGKEFRVAPVADALLEPEADVERRCQELARRRQFLREVEPHSYDDGTSRARYAFLHSLHQKVIYERIPAASRAELHRRIGESEERFHADPHAVAAELATHFARCGDWQRAVRHLAVAGQSALMRFSHQEAIGYFRSALDALARTPELSTRAEEELELLVGLGAALLTTRGFGAPEVVPVYSRAHELCRVIGETPRIFPVLRGLYAYHLTRAELDEAHELARQLARLARHFADPDLMPEACFALGSVLFHRGDLTDGVAELERGSDCYDVTQHGRHNLVYGQDPGVYCGAQGGWALWIQGHPDRALERARRALSLAEELGAPPDLGLALVYLATIHLVRGEAAEAERVSERAMATSAEHELTYWMSASSMCRGAALSRLGRTSDAIPLIDQGFAGWNALGMHAGGAHWLGHLADAHRADGNLTDAREVLDRAFELVETHGLRSWEAELHRLRGELALAHEASGGRSRAEACFLRALDVSQRQGARSLELRAAMSLARLRAASGRCREAHSLVEEPFEWFTEGYGTADLIAAKEFWSKLSA